MILIYQSQMIYPLLFFKKHEKIYDLRQIYAKTQKMKKERWNFSVPMAEDMGLELKNDAITQYDKKGSNTLIPMFWAFLFML